MAAEAAGLIDVYRQHYPDPVAHEGLTWPADRPFVKGYNPARAGQAADRIDLMYASESAAARSVQVVGEAASDYSDIGVDPWPSDHRAIVATFELTLGQCPDVLAASRTLNRIGDQVHLRFHAPAAVGGSVVAASVSGSNRQHVVVEGLGSASGGAEFAAASLGPGEFNLLLRSPDDTEVARTGIWIVEPETAPDLTVGRSRYAVGEGIDVAWSFAPGNRADWIAVFDRGADPARSRRKVWTYTGATVAGRHVLDGTLQPPRWPLAAGEYTVHLLLDDVWDSLAEADFSVTTG
jgi:hypothetical protein